MDAQVTKNRKTLNSDTFKSIDFEFRHEEKCPPDLPASLFGPSKSWGAELQIPPQNGSLFGDICPVEKYRFGGSPRQEYHLKSIDLPVRPRQPGGAPGEGRKRPPLGAGIHAAELG